MLTFSNEDYYGTVEFQIPIALKEGIKESCFLGANTVSFQNKGSIYNHQIISFICHDRSLPVRCVIFFNFLPFSSWGLQAEHGINQLGLDYLQELGLPFQIMGPEVSARTAIRFTCNDTSIAFRSYGFKARQNCTQF